MGGRSWSCTCSRTELELKLLEERRRAELLCSDSPVVLVWLVCSSPMLLRHPRAANHTLCTSSLYAHVLEHRSSAFFNWLVTRADWAAGVLHALLQDDFGWADADWHRPAGWKEAATPHMMELLKEGVELDNMHAFKFCAPTRSSIQSGRNPIHVNVQNYQPVVWDSADPQRDKVSGYAGIPTKMTGVSAVLKGVGYATHYTGKWDCGMATEAHTPKGRGYDTSLFYFHHVRSNPRHSPPQFCPRAALFIGSGLDVRRRTTTTGQNACEHLMHNRSAQARIISWLTSGTTRSQGSGSTTLPSSVLRGSRSGPKTVRTERCRTLSQQTTSQTQLASTKTMSSCIV